MADIRHRIGVEASTPDNVYDALTTLDGLSGWWAENTSGDTGLGGVIEIRFAPGGFDMRIAELDPGRRVRWDVVGGSAEWIGTSIHRDLRQDRDCTIVRLRRDRRYQMARRQQKYADSGQRCGCRRASARK
jgi:uncharacterized protein YndB with AHSA1/START domain